MTSPDALSSAPISPTAAPADIAARATSTAQPGLTTPPPAQHTARVLGIIGVILLAVVGLFVLVYVVVSLGPDAFALAGVMALVPLAIVFFGVRWIDRWEPEPRLAVVFAFLWGAAVAVIVALVVGAGLDPFITLITQNNADAYDFIGAAIQAPLVEESAKGLGLLVIFFAARKYFDGPVDGIVYAAWIAGGFAFTENIFYFGGQLVESGSLTGDGVFEIFLIRGIMSPFAHVMFTSATGIALGFATRLRSPFAGIGLFFVGLAPAMFLHALWNGALFFVSDFYGYYFLIQVPLFVISVVLVMFLRRQEERLTRARLDEYAAVGWFSPAEIPSLSTGAGRRQALAWAARFGKRRAMKQYIQNATRLAFARQRIITGRGGLGAQADEAALLGAIVESRASLAGS
ncbi:MAG: PrsW family intramembrane metalloprotease [Salinibacterium sp.]|nr:PrsW family intramembrane metalloprotease [Salinibacterium sp.]